MRLEAGANSSISMGANIIISRGQRGPDSDCGRVRGHGVVGLIPAAGRARRLAPLPCSKELLPIGLGTLAGCEAAHPKVASQFLVDQFRAADVRKVIVVIRQGKWDIPGYWSDGSRLGMHFAYVVVDETGGPPDTIDRAHAFVREEVVVFGFPDILFHPETVFAQLLARLSNSTADVVLGLFPAHNPSVMDMIEVDRRGHVRDLLLKPRQTTLRWAWICAVWMPTFTEFLHGFLGRMRRLSRGQVRGNRRIDPQGDLPVGAVIQAAIRERLTVEAVKFSNGRYLDVGTASAWAQASRWAR